MAETTNPSSDEGRLTELSHLAAAKAALKDYHSAADLYSQAAELQATLKGEMAIDNADLLYSYGKCLYHVALSQSDVFGSRAAVQNMAESTQIQEREGSAPVHESLVRQDGEKASNFLQQTASTPNEHGGGLNGSDTASHTFFQFNGDEDFEDEDEEGTEDVADPASEDNDFENAFETLDMARVLLLRKLDTSPSCLSENDTLDIRRVKERLSDIYDLQAEISLEGERFLDAVSDLRAALELKSELFPLEDSTLAECHYKLSLALEFSSVSLPSSDGSAAASQVDFQMREEAAKHMEVAIRSCELRVSIEQRKLEAVEATDVQELAKIKRHVEDVKEIVSDMKQRLTDLRNPPNAVSDFSRGVDQINAKSILNQVRSASDKVLLEEAIEGANDLNAFVRKRKRTSSAAAGNGSEKSIPSKQAKGPTT
ncbi:predicted protein [Uncinocarpus reesii 1704]|uniref:Tetratricopeptide SHNi-TPR domain-containing protein n=1 Tax=Uncinocarpus reesii (strain UAMH 1704) TaxID=336963 RepID=C4JT88_UNCRE|nr:uncharacterized protein UREG_05677 [Uncinocarpus reesii 1704]EEP80835.1 predicted protein [Uncinocarpus reesii 1704]